MNDLKTLALSIEVCTFLLLAAVSICFLVRYRTCLSTINERTQGLKHLPRPRTSTFIFQALTFCGLAYAASGKITPFAIHEQHNTSSLAFYPKKAVAPLTCEDELEIGNQLIKKYATREAKIHFERALSLNPESEQALIKLAEYWNNGYDIGCNFVRNPAKSIEYAAQVIVINPKNIDAHYYLADSYCILDRDELALPHAQYITAKDPDNVTYWRLLCCIELALCHHKAALRAADEHLRLHPNEVEALQDRIAVLEAMGLIKEAQVDVARIEKIQSH